MSRSLVFGIVAALFVSGCTGGSTGAPTGASANSGASVVASGEALPDAGSIEGIVIDDTNLPIADATVALTPSALQVVTDASGSFGFHNLAPGTYTITALRLGYDSSARKEELEPNEAAKVTVTLRPVALEEVYKDVFGPFYGYFDCRIGTPRAISSCAPVVNNVIFPNDKDRMAFKMSSEDWQTFVGEATWKQGTFATSVGMAAYMSHANRTSTHWWCEADGRPPIKFRYEKELDSECNTKGSASADPEPKEKHQLLLIADPGFGGTSLEKPPLRLILQQKFELWTSVFYGEPAAPDYTALGDG